MQREGGQQSRREDVERSHGGWRMKELKMSLACVWPQVFHPIRFQTESSLKQKHSYGRTKNSFLKDSHDLP